MTGWTWDVRGLRTRGRAAAGVAVHAGQRLLRHPRGAARVRGGRRALPRAPTRRAATTGSPPTWRGAGSRTRTWSTCPTGCRSGSASAGDGPGPWLTPDTATVLEHRQTLHLCAGLLERRTRYAWTTGRRAGGAAAAPRAHGRPPSGRAAHRVHGRGLLRRTRSRGGPGRRRHQRRAWRATGTWTAAI